MDVKVVEVNHCAFVDFAEETAAARVVEKAQERPFCLGDDTLVVEVKKPRPAYRGNQRSRPSPKRE